MCPECPLRAEVERLTQENDRLRALAAQLTWCHYCGLRDMSKCAHGFPGCPRADDLLAGS